MSGFYGDMNQKQWLFLVVMLVICAARAFAQAGDEATVGWDPTSCWDGSQMDEGTIFQFMLWGPLWGVVMGGLRAISRRTGGKTPELLMVRFR